jgi:uncharacterized LabA/DUF88 family protein
MPTDEKAMVFFDARNIIKGQEEYRKTGGQSDFGYPEIMEFFRKRFNVVRGYYYDGAPHRSERTKGRQSFFDVLRRTGITLRLKEIDFSKPGHSQKGVDIYLASDMISLAYENAYDIAILVSGDGDFVALVDLVKSKGKRVWVLSFACCISELLRESADKVLSIERIPELHRTYARSTESVGNPRTIPDRA